MRRVFILWTTCLAVLMLASCSSSEPAAGAAGLNLLIITLDTTRADAIGLYGNPDNVSPNIDRLGREGVVFKECYSPVPLTLPAHCSLFTGRYPIAHRVRNNGTYVLPADEVTLAEVFKEQGYATSAIVASFTVASKFGLNQGFDSYEEDFESGGLILNFNTEIPADRVYEKFNRWLDLQSGRRFFAWVHFYDPHSPYVNHGDVSEGDRRSPWKLYESEVRFVDSYIGKISEALRARNLSENTVIVIVGDHGEAFGEHKERGHGIFCYEESLRVPLILHNPKVFPEAKSLAGRVSLVDLMPSLLELCRLKIPAEVQGKSFLNMIRKGGQKPERLVYFESLFGQEECNWAPITGIIDGDDKYISLPDAELYDLKNDIRESRNLFSANRDLARTLDKKLENFIRSHAAAKIPSRRELTETDVEKLKALGYVSGFSGQARPMTDPKRAIDVYLAVGAIKDLITQKNYVQAEDLLNAFLAKNPGADVPDIYEISYEIAKEKGRVREGMEILKKAIGLFPEREGFKVFLAMEYIEAGDLTSAQDFCRSLLAENDRMTSAYVLLADVEDRLNNVEASLLNYEKAVSLEPQNGMVKAKLAGLLVKKGDLARAQATLDDLASQPAVVRSSDYLDATSALSRSFLAAGDSEKALAITEKATTLNPEDPAVWLNLGSIYFDLKEYDLALQNFDKSLSLDKNFALAYSNIGQVYLSRFVAENDSTWAEKALGYFDRAIQLNPGLAAAYNGRASILLASRQVDKAISDYERAIKLDPNMMDAYINVSIALRQQGRYADALKYLDICKGKFYPQLTLQDRNEIDRMYSEIQALKDRQ